MILRIYLVVFLFLFGAIQCNSEPSEERIIKIQEDKSLDLNSALSQILPLVFPHLLKDWSLEEDTKTKLWKLNVSYGGTTALTFNSQKEYFENTVRSHSMYNARLVAAVSKLPIQFIRLSLSKPLYVKGENHPEVGIQEFEIYRTLLPVEDAKSILSSSSELSPFSDLKHQKTKLIELFEKIKNVSKPELNQLHLITVE